MSKRPHPLVAWAIEEVRLQSRGYHAVTREAGLAINTISTWSRGVQPSVGNLDVMLRTMGYRLAIIPLTSDHEDGEEWHGKTLDEGAPGAR